MRVFREFKSDEGIKESAVEALAPLHLTYQVGGAEIDIDAGIQIERAIALSPFYFVEALAPLC